MDESGSRPWRILRLGTAWFIVGTWGVSMIRDQLDNAYDPSSGLLYLMLVVAGSLFGPSAVKTLKSYIKGDGDQ